MQLAVAYRLAQERLGLAVALATLQVWRSFNPYARTPDRAPVKALIARVVGFRALQRLLAARYLNASRALTGIAGRNFEGESYGLTVTLDRLLGDFESAVKEVQRQSNPAASSDTEVSVGATTEQSDTFDERVGRNESRAEASVDGLEAALAELRKLFPAEPIDVDDDIEWPKDGDDYAKVMDGEIDRALDALDDFIDNVDDLLTTESHFDEDTGEEVVEGHRPTATEIRHAIENRTRATGFDLAAFLEQITSRYGREFVDEFGNDDSAVIGWMRVTSAGPCAFCAMLAAQGIVYKSRSTASETAGGSDGNGNRGRNTTGGFTRGETARSARARADVNDVGGTGLNQYHANCRCSVVPVYFRDQPRQERDRFFTDLYASATDKSKLKNQPNAALNAFRRELARKYREGNVPGGSPSGLMAKPNVPSEE